MGAVLFDLGNTLVSYYAAADFAPVLRKCLRACIEVLEPERVIYEDELFERACRLNIERPDHTVWPLEARLKVLFPQATLDASLERRLTIAFLQPIFATAIVDPAVFDTLAALRTAGFRTAIVSNTPWGSPADLWRAELARLNLLAPVDATVFCMDVGYRKPHCAPFERALELLGARAEEAFFVGDDPKWDVAGAEQAGIRPILLARTSGESVPPTFPAVRNLRAVITYVTTTKR
jgi:HAD superfamily hydrolase (TIGR01509 family)